MKKKIVTICLVAALLLLAAGGTLAYFTAEDDATNTFTVGNVDIELLEPSWDPDGNGEQIADPGVAVAKDPYVKNTGENDAYVRINVTVSDAAAFKTAMAKYGLTDLAAIFDGHSEAAWTFAGSSEDTVNDTITYTYNYNSVVPSGSNTTYLFTSVKLPAKFTNEDVADMKGGFTIEVAADAIQAAGFTDVVDAFDHF